MLNNPGRTTIIHDIGKLLWNDSPKGFTPTNIVSGFTVTGTCPFNPDEFDDHEFAPSDVTDRPAEGSTTDRLVGEEITGWSSCITYILPKSAINKRGPDFQKADTSRAAPILQDRAPKNQQSRWKVKSLVLTNTPVKKFMEEEANTQKKARQIKKKKTTKIPESSLEC